VSKDTLDAALLGPDGRTRGNRFANAPAGFAALVAWADRHAPGGVVHFCLEATGPYSAALADSLHAAGRPVSVANPARVKAYMKACGQGNKTDPADARAGDVPLFDGRLSASEPTAYVCERFVCKLPVSTAEALSRELAGSLQPAHGMPPAS